MIFAKQSTAIIVTVGPVLDADGVAVTDGVVGDFKISKNGAAPAALNGSATLTHRHTGHYSLSLTATDVNTVGTVEVVIDDTVNACPMKEITVVEGTTYDVLFLDAAPGPASPINITAGTITTATNVTTVNGLAANVITATSINADAITAAKIADGAIDAATFAAGAITATVIATGAIDADAIADNAIDAGAIAADAISATKIATGAITAAKFAAGAIDAAAIANGAIDAATFAAGAIDAAALAADAGTEIGTAVWATAARTLTALDEDSTTLDLDATIRAAVGLASANLDTQLAVLPDISTSVQLLKEAIVLFSAEDNGGGTTTTVTTDALSQADDDYWKGNLIVFITGDALGQARLITDFDEGTDTLTFTPALTASAANAAFIIIPFTDQFSGAGSAPTAAEVADAVWDEDATGHQTQGSFGQAIGDPVADTNTIFKAVVTDASGATAGADTTAIKAKTDSLTFSTANRVDSQVFGMEANVVTATAIANAAIDAATFTAGAIDAAALAADAGTEIATAVWASAARTLTALDEDSTTLDLDATVRAAVGLASANLDTQLADIETKVDDLETRLGTPSDLGSGATVAANLVDIEGLTDNLPAIESKIDTIDGIADAILVDTAEIGAAGAGLTNINLPDQTMNIIGDITGNLSGSVGSVTGAVGSVTGNVTGSVGSLAAQAKADVNAEVVDALATDTYAEPGQGNPAATTTLAAKINYLFKAWRNKKDQSSTEEKLYADDASTVDQKRAVSDSGTVLTKGEMATGP